MKLRLSLTLFVLIFQFTNSTSNYKYFYDVLSNIVTTYKLNKAELDSQYRELIKLPPNFIVEYFSYLSLEEEKDYWEAYYLLAKVAFLNNEMFADNKQENFLNLSFYESLLKNKSKEYSKKLEYCKNETLNKLLRLRLNWNNEFIHPHRNKIEFYDFQFNNQYIEAISKTELYKKVKVLPKGVIQHIHLKAGLNYEKLFEIFSILIRNEKEDFLVFTYEILYPHPYNIKFNKLMITKSNIGLSVGKYNEYKAKFISKIIDKKGLCKADEFIDEDLNLYQRAYFYLTKCKNVTVFSNKSLEHLGMHDYIIKPFDQLKEFLKQEITLLQSKTDLINFISESLLNQDMNKSEDILNYAVWMKTETVFSIMGGLFKNPDFFNIFNDLFYKSLKEDNILGIEINNSKSFDFPLNSFTYSSKYGIYNGIIMAGIKNNPNQSLLNSVLSDYHKLETPIDFIGNEDDPINGSRNFFSYSLSKANPLNNQSYFSLLFNHLKNNDISFVLHAGETSYFPKGNITEEYMKNNYINDNLIHAALLKIKRIGHGFAIENNHLLKRIIKKKGIQLEINTISNDILGYVHIVNNPFLSLLRQGIEIAISNDDPGFFGYNGISMDWFRILTETDIKPEEVYRLMSNSLKYSTIKEIKNLNIETNEKLKKEIYNNITNFYESLNCDTYFAPDITNKNERMQLDKDEKEKLQKIFEDKIQNFRLNFLK